MWTKIFILSVLIGISPCIHAQKPKTPVPADSAKFYKSLEKIAKKRKFSKWLFSQIFTIPKKAKTPVVRKKRVAASAHINVEGKIIRNIDILTLDPFGYDIKDTSIKPSGFLRVTGNKLHVKTLPIAIKNLLLFSSNQPYDSLIVRESERLIRKQKFVHDVTFRTNPVKGDSVDISIRVLDIWSLTPKGSLSATAVSLGFIDQNFLGSGQQFDNDLAINTQLWRSAYRISYYVPNIKNSYVGARIQYQINHDRSFIKSFEIERPFYSSFAKWGGGILFAQKLNRDSIVFPDDSIKTLQNFKYNTQDMWVGKSWRLFGGKSELQRTTNFIISSRFQHIKYLEKPGELYDSLRIYSNERFVYFGIGIASRQYVQDKYIFNYGLIEDVPRGKIYNLTVGFQKKNNINRLYLGLKVSWGEYYRWGYLSPNFEYGRFVHNGNFEEGAIDVGVNFFSELFSVGRWKIRQFIKPEVMIGIKRLPTDKLTLNNENGITGFSATDLYGIHKTLITYQTQSYAPWDLVGFRFGPYLVYTMGILGNYNIGYKNAKIYSLLGFGILIKNDFLVFKTFQLSLAYYPIIPGKGKNITRFNSYRTTDFGFQDFDIEKPTTVTYH